MTTHYSGDPCPGCGYLFDKETGTRLEGFGHFPINERGSDFCRRCSDKHWDTTTGTRED
jgi:rubredoxin